MQGRSLRPRLPRSASLSLAALMCCCVQALAQQPAPQKLPNDAPAATPTAAADIARILEATIRPCWNVPSGMTEVVSIRVQMARDGVPANAEIVDRRKYDASREYRALADSALRAVVNPRCQPWPLPRESYDKWRKLVINFDPRDR